MKRLFIGIAAAGMLVFASHQSAQAQVQFIPPTVELSLPNITFDSNINPLPGSLSNDALNIIRAHQVALQQVQAAILYLKSNRQRILEGNNQWYNSVFGDFYNPNSQFSGLYDRTTQRLRPVIDPLTGLQAVDPVSMLPLFYADRYGNLLTDEVYNTSHFDRILTVFTQIQAALNRDTNYQWGAQTGNAASQAALDTYRNATATIGDPLFGTITAPPTLSATEDRGIRQWGYSTSYTPKHANQIATDPANPLRWDEDNDVSTQAVPLTPDQELAFFKDRLDIFGTSTGGLTGTNEVYVGGGFLNESIRSNSSVVGEPNPFFHPTEFEQYQQLIMSMAQSAGSLGTAGDPSIEPGLVSLFGQSAFFWEALDAASFASFVDLFKPVQEGGVGDGSLLPPPGKNADLVGVFDPIVP